MTESIVVIEPPALPVAMRKLQTAENAPSPRTLAPIVVCRIADTGSSARRRHVTATALEQDRFSLPDRDSLQADLVSCGFKFRSDGKLLLESKDEMRKRRLPSSDEADAVALCFSEPDGGAFVRNKRFNRDLTNLYGGLYF